MGNAATTETFMLLPLCGGFLCTLLALERRSLLWSFAGGMLVAATTLFKQVALFDGLF
jgi:hypothetical protein